jgi:hypothetical protein
MIERPWLELKDVAPMLGVTPATAKNKISNGTFEVPTYRLGKKVVVDKAVLDAFFEARRKAGLRKLENSTSI